MVPIRATMKMAKDSGLCCFDRGSWIQHGGFISSVLDMATNWSEMENMAGDLRFCSVVKINEITDGEFGILCFSLAYLILRQCNVVVRD